MKLFVLAVCCVALAAARPQGKGDEKEKGNPVEGLVKLCFGLAEEALGDEDKRSWEDVFGQLAPICEAIIEEFEKDCDDDKPTPTGPPPSGRPNKRGRGGKNRKSSGDDDDDDDDDDRKGKKNGKSSGDDDDDDDDYKPMPSGLPPSGPPPSGSPMDLFDMRGKNGNEGGEEEYNYGPRPTGPPWKKEGKDDEGKGGKRKGGEGKDDEGPNPAEDLLKICEGLAKMAENEEEEGITKRSLEALLGAMKAVCEAAFDQAEEDLADL